MSKRRSYYSLQSFVSYLRRHKWPFSLVFLIFIVSNIFLAAIPVFIGRLVGDLAANPIDHHAVTLNVIALIVCSSVHDLSWRASEVVYLKFMNPLSNLYETIVYKQIIKKPYPYFVDKFTGKVSSYINTLSQEFGLFIENICYNYANMVVRLVSLVIILAVINWYTAAIFLAGIAMMFAVGRYTIRNSAKYEKILADVRSSKNGKIVDSVANFVNIKSFRTESTENHMVEVEQAKTIDASNRAFFWNVVFWGSMSLFIRHVIWPAAIILNVYLFMQHKLSLAELATLLSSILLFSDYIWSIIWNVSQFNLKLARIEEAHHYLFGDVNIIKEHFKEEAAPLPAPDFNESLGLHNLTFAYPDKQDVKVLSGINLTIKKGEKIGIVGKSGSGKTTLTKLLLGYYPIDDNRLQIDGIPTNNHQVAQLIAFVPQDTSLFHRSIADNIAYANDKQVTRAQIKQAAKRAYADEFIVKVNEGYDALVGERGVKLSAGQRQRIAIARAFLDDKPILVLDEATSALDSESEVLVQRALEALWENRTVIAIAHRLSTLQHMDRIIVMDKGTIIEEGTHQELLKKKGKYAQLWAHQSGGFLEE